MDRVTKFSTLEGAYDSYDYDMDDQILYTDVE